MSAALSNNIWLVDIAANLFLTIFTMNECAACLFIVYFKHWKLCIFVCNAMAVLQNFFYKFFQAQYDSICGCQLHSHHSLQHLAPKMKIDKPNQSRFLQLWKTGKTYTITVLNSQVRVMLLIRRYAKAMQPDSSSSAHLLTQGTVARVKTNFRVHVQRK